MPRTGHIAKREIEPDPLYESRLVAKLINKIMLSGKKQVAQKLVYAAFDKIQKETGNNPLVVFEEAVKNVTPRMEVRPRRVGGATYMVPLEVKGSRREHLALKFLTETAKERPNVDYVDKDQKVLVFAGKLAQEIIEASQATGGAIQRKENIHRMAEANKAFAHFRW